MIYVQNGDAEAALVSHALAVAPDVRVIEVDAALYDPLIQTLGIVAATNQHDRAAALAQFILGGEGQREKRWPSSFHPAGDASPLQSGDEVGVLGEFRPCWTMAKTALTSPRTRRPDRARDRETPCCAECRRPPD